MPSLGRFEDAAKTRRDFPMASGMCWAGAVLCEPLGRVTPHVFYVDQDPFSVAARHYHDACQFQVIVRGDGELGGHRLSPLSVHYAAFQTVYGPINAGPEGLGYLTLRIQYGVGINFWPETRERMIKDVKRGQVTVHVPAGLEADVDKVTQLIAPDDNGLAAKSLQIAPSGLVPVSPDTNSAGVFCLLGAGEVSLDGQAMARLDVAWIGLDETALLRAGVSGAQVLILQMPIGALQDKAKLAAAPA